MLALVLFQNVWVLVVKLLKISLGPRQSCQIAYLNVDSKIGFADNFADVDTDNWVDYENSAKNLTVENPKDAEIVVFGDNFRSDKSLEADQNFNVAGIHRKLSLEQYPLVVANTYQQDVRFSKRFHIVSSQLLFPQSTPTPLLSFQKFGLQGDVS